MSGKIAGFFPFLLYLGSLVPVDPINFRSFMKKFFFLFLIAAIFFQEGFTQSSSLDKNKVLGYFQDQQYDEAMIYLLPLIHIDSSNIDALGFLAYANYMD